ncbi:MAG: dienelactone hydrolase family protein [Pacificimonas sp.]
MTEHEIEIAHDDKTLKCLLVLPDAKGPHPTVVIYHQWSGRSPHEEGHARKLAEHGYAAVAVDLYGGKKRGSSMEENQALMTPLKEDRAELRARMMTLIKAIGEQPDVDAKRMAAMGYCFGGLCAIDTARAGADVKGVASFHGLLDAPEGLDSPKITASVAIHHGWDDPMAPPEHVTAVGKELTERGADWYLTAYGNACHAFTNKDANDRENGMVYNAKADARSWRDLLGFLNEVLR